MRIELQDRTALGTVLREARDSRQMTQRDLAAATGIPQGRVSRIERGATSTDLRQLSAFADAVGLSIVIDVSFSGP